MHDLGVAHLDAHPRNMICKMESGALVDIRICDFGGSQQFTAPIEEALCYFPTHLRDFPESPYDNPSSDEPKPFNPFAVDVYGVGWSFLTCEVRDGSTVVEALGSLTDLPCFFQMNEPFSQPRLLDLFEKMTSTAFNERPTMTQALNDLRKIFLESLLYPDRHAARNSLKDEEGAQTLTPSGVIAPVTSEDVAAYQTRFNRLQAEGAPGWKVRV